MKIAIIYNHDITGVINTFGMQNKEFYSEKNVKRVASALERNGHNVQIMDGNMYVIERLQNFLPKTIEGEQMGMVFNMAYGIQGESRYTHIPSLLEMLGIPYVGSTPAGHALALDKVMTKIIWQNHNIPTPQFWVVNSATDDLSKVIYPVIVKPKMESVSFGLKVVYNEPDLREAVNFVVTEFQQQALVEQFIRGREFCVGLLGNNPIEAFPVLEIDLEGDPNAIQTVDNKKGAPKRKICPAGISDELAAEMVRLSIDAFKALNLRDFSRVDLRLDEDGTIYLLEINSMASLGATGSYSYAAQVAGYDFPSLVNKMLDVAAVRYFSSSLSSLAPQGKSKELSYKSRLRTYIRSRQQNSEKLLSKLVNFNTHVRNVEGVNQASAMIINELTQLGFTNEVYPQLEVGNMYYFTNSFEPSVDYLILLSMDDRKKLSEQEHYEETEHRLYGTGIWDNKAGHIVTLNALWALRFVRMLRKLRIGILLVSDSSINNRLSKSLIEQKSRLAGNILGLRGGDMQGSIVASRSGSATYTLSIKLVDSSNAKNVPLAAKHFFKTLTAITDIGDKEEVISPHNVDFSSSIFRVSAYGTARISVRFNTMEEFYMIESKIKKAIAYPKSLKKKFQVQLEGGMTYSPMLEKQVSTHLIDKVVELNKVIDTRVTLEHRWSSSEICNVADTIPSLDGLGAIGGYDKQKNEFILRSSIIDRALLLAMLLSK